MQLRSRFETRSRVLVIRAQNCPQVDSGDRPLGAVLFPSKKARREGLNVESIDLDWKDWAILSCREEFPCRYGYNDDKRLNWTSYPLNEWQLRMSAMVDTNSQEAKEKE